MTTDQADEQPRWRRFDVVAQRAEALAAAREAIKAGECVVLPTDTVYGIGADPFDPAAVQRLLDAKMRGRDMPPPVLIAESAMLGALAADPDERIEALGQAYWPGPLTLILRAQHSLSMDLGDSNDTIAVRVPDQDFTRALLRRTGPLAVSSANVSGAPAAQTVDEAIEQLGDSVAVYLDAGPASGPVPSTIIDLTDPDSGRILRRGRLDADELARLVPGLSDASE